MTLEIANRLYELRKKNNLSQEELAEKLGVSRQAVSKWERSEASPDTDNLIALAKIYGLSLDELIYGEKTEEDKEDATTEQVTDDEDTSYINIDDDGNKITIGPDGIVVEEKNGNTVKLNINGKIMGKILDRMDVDYDDKFDDDGEEYDDDDEDDELYETIYFTEGDIKGTDKKLHLKIKNVKATKFWMHIPYAVICALLYLVFGFYNILGGWALSWVIFITIPIYYSLVEAIYKRKFTDFAYPVFCAFIYLVFGLYFKNWHPSWVIFVTVAIYYPIAEALDRLIHGRK